MTLNYLMKKEYLFIFTASEREREIERSYRLEAKTNV
jgi:hypothetical protein